jgi:hypothetical protein
MTVAETARRLNIGTIDLVYRLCRTGVLASKREENNRLNIDPLSVEEYRTRVSAKRNSASFVEPDVVDIRELFFS